MMSCYGGCSNRGFQIESRLRDGLGGYKTRPEFSVKDPQKFRKTEGMTLK